MEAGAELEVAAAIEVRSLAGLSRVVVVASLVAACGGLVRIGGDARWLAALGGAIVRLGRVPAGVPYAAAPSGGWHNVPVLGELVFYGLDRGLGDRGLFVAQLVAVAVALGVLALGSPVGGGLVLLLVPLGALDSFVVVRAQLFSLALFPVLVLLLRREADRPSRRIWLVVPLIALWSNLHGAVLIGFAVTVLYLLLARARSDPRTAFGVFAAGALAIFATPAALDTPAYYRSVFGNVWASSHTGLWERWSPHHPLDVLFLAAAATLGLIALRARPRAWELVAAAGLAAGVADAARNEVWLVLFLAPAAMRGLRLVRPRARSVRFALALLPIAAGALLVVIGWRGHVNRDPGAGARLQEQAIRAADGTPILADPYDAEQLALRGATVLIGDPIDAFAHSEQIAYERWLEGSAGAAGTLRSPVRVMLVLRMLPAQRELSRDPAFCRRSADAHAVLYTRCASRR